MRRARLFALIALFALVLAGCGDDTESADEGGGGDNGAQVDDGSGANGDGDGMDDGDGAEILLYNPDGVGDATIGTDADAAIDHVSSVLGPPTNDDSAAECPSGANRLVSWDGLTLVFADGKMVGYIASSANASDRLIETSQKSLLKPGDPESQLVALFPDATIEETSLGREFWTGGDGEGYRGVIEDEIISSLGAGDLCVFR